MKGNSNVTSLLVKKIDTINFAEHTRERMSKC